MSDPFRQINPGDVYPLSASWRNSVTRMLQWRQRGGGDRAIANPQSSTATTIVYVKNDSGSDLARFSVLAITGIFPNPADNEIAFANGPSLRGETPTSSTAAESFCVLQAPAKAGAIVPACIAGVTVAKVNVVSEADTTCGLDTTNVLKSGKPGAHIFWKESGTGTKWALIRFGGGDASSFRVAKITSGGSVTYPTQTQADGFAGDLTTDSGNPEDTLNTAATGLTTVTDPGMASVATSITGVAANTTGMMENPQNVAETLAGLVTTLEGYAATSQALIDAHNADIADGGSGTLSSAEVTDHNSIITACTSAANSIKTVAAALAAFASGAGNAAIYAVNDYGVLAPTGESVAYRCELLADGESVTGFVYIGRSADDGLYRIVARFPGSGSAAIFLTDVRVDGTTLQKKTRPGVATGDESDWTTWHTGSACE